VNAKGLARGPAAVQAAGKTVEPRMATHTWRRGKSFTWTRSGRVALSRRPGSQQTIIITIVHVKTAKGRMGSPPRR
jgi:hypothetical protein